MERVHSAQLLDLLQFCTPRSIMLPVPKTRRHAKQNVLTCITAHAMHAGLQCTGRCPVLAVTTLTRNLTEQGTGCSLYHLLTRVMLNVATVDHNVLSPGCLQQCLGSGGFLQSCLATQRDAEITTLTPLVNLMHHETC